MIRTASEVAVSLACRPNAIVGNEAVTEQIVGYSKSRLLAPEPTTCAFAGMGATRGNRSSMLPQDWKRWFFWQQKLPQLRWPLTLILNNADILLLSAGSPSTTVSVSASAILLPSTRFAYQSRLLLQNCPRQRKMHVSRYVTARNARYVFFISADLLFL